MKRLVGFDSAGETFQVEDRVFRGIYSGHGALCRDVLSACIAHGLFEHGIVVTCESPTNPCPDLSYDLVLEHEKIPFVSYPHEWSGSMLKDAALLHIDLFTELGPHGLTIKDWHPYNILFKGTEPIFVDFTSIIPIDNLKEEEYLTPPQIPKQFRYVWNTASAYFYEMYRRMCVPYFLLPLYFMSQGQYRRAHERMFETVLNAAGTTINSDEVFGNDGTMAFRFRAMEWLKKVLLIQRGNSKRAFLSLLRKEVNSLSVSRKTSTYSSYYESKGENFGFEPCAEWRNKHKVVHNAIMRFRPDTLLDVASNTGWFSILAAKLGCQVVAFDVDDACIDKLYKRARKESLSILSLVMDLTKLTPDIAPLESGDESSRSLIGGNFPLLLSAEKRFRCDMVLALGIVHHLALGMGWQFCKIVQMLESLTNKHLLVEFVGKNDELIMASPEFFPSMDSDPHGFEWYNLDNFMAELSRHFRQIDVSPSHPDSRQILICKK